MSELETGFRIGDVLAMVKRQWVVVAVAALLGALAGYLVFASAAETYSATSRVEVKTIRLNQFDTTGAGGNPTAEEMATEKDKVKSDEVAEAIRSELGLQGDNRAILARVTVVSEEKSNVLRITFDGDNAQQAQRGANAAAIGYLEARKAAATSTRDAAVERLNGEINEAKAAVTEAQQAFDAAPSGTGERSQAQVELQTAQNELRTLQEQRQQLNQFQPETVGAITREATLPAATTSKMAMGKGLGVFGLFVMAGLAGAWFLDRRDGLGGVRRKIEQIVPNANVRILPGADGGTASPAELDAAIDRLAVELVAGGAPGKAASVLVVGAGYEPPVALAEELASSLAFAGIPALFVLAGSTDRELRHAQLIPSFADLVTSASVAGPAGLPARAGEGSLSSGPSVTWLRPTGSAEAAGLLRRAVVDSLITRAGRERFEAVVFVAPSPTRTAAAAGLGQWVGRTALIVGRDDRQQADDAATALAEADVRVTEVVWT